MISILTAIARSLLGTDDDIAPLDPQTHTGRSAARRDHALKELVDRGCAHYRFAALRHELRVRRSHVSTPLTETSALRASLGNNIDKSCRSFLLPD
jgi:hypothetical protein